MSDREALRLDFLRSAGLAGAVRAPLPGDASTRRYERLTPTTGPTLMLMDQAPAAESQPCDPRWTPEQRHAAGWNAVARLSAGRIEAFAAVAAHLKSLGLSAPEIPSLDAANGLAVLEDFGDALFARVIEDGADETPLYLAAIEALAVLHEAGAPPETLHGPGGDWPLLTYDETALQGGADLFVEWLPKLDDRVRFDAVAVADWIERGVDLVQDQRQQCCGMLPCCSRRNDVLNWRLPRASWDCPCHDVQLHLARQATRSHPGPGSCRSFGFQGPRMQSPATPTLRPVVAKRIAGAGPESPMRPISVDKHAHLAYRATFFVDGHARQARHYHRVVLHQLIQERRVLALQREHRNRPSRTR